MQHGKNEMFTALALGISNFMAVVILVVILGLIVLKEVKIGDVKGTQIVKNQIDLVTEEKVSVKMVPLVWRAELSMPEFKEVISSEAVDESYDPLGIIITKENKELMCKLVFGEAGNQGYYGQLLVAQAIRDTIVYEGNGNIEELIKKYRYSASLDKGYTEETVKACDYILGGGFAVKHRILYFYAPKIVKANFHETQKFVVEYEGHRFFDRSE
jgi:hypothetical protein